MVKDGLPEDVEKDAEASVQKIHDKYIKRIDDMLAAKEKENKSGIISKEKFSPKDRAKFFKILSPIKNIAITEAIAIF